MSTVQIWTDGTARKGQVAWGYVIVVNNEIVAQEGGETRERRFGQIGGELSAIMRGLSHAARLGHKQVEICSDLEGAPLWVSGRWKAKNQATRAYKAWMQKRWNEGIRFTFRKAVSGDRFNKLAHDLCRIAVEMAIDE